MTSVPDRLREQVRQRANGRCEYCGKPENVNTFSHQVDHIFPEDHLGTSEFTNLAWACFRCNNAKGRDISSVDEATGIITPLYNPRTQKWDEHFEMQTDAVMKGRTAIGRVTVRLLGMNRERQLETRFNLIEEGRW